MPVRRAADPVNVQYVWDSIRFLDTIEQVPDQTKIVKNIQKVSRCVQSQAELYIKQTLQDRLIEEVKKPANRSASIPAESEVYRINKQEDLETPIDDGFDWYCIECHLAGDVITCKSCYRVFHKSCSTNARHRQNLFPKYNHVNTNSTANIINKEPIILVGDTDNNEKSVIDGETSQNLENLPPIIEKADHIYDEAMCSMCNLAAVDHGHGLEIDEFNHLLNFIFLRIKSWVPEQLTTKLEPTKKQEWHTQSELRWRSGQLFYQHVDMSLVELKIRTKEFTKFSQFHADIVTMQHNLAIFHGVDSQEYGAGELMMKDTKHDISEIQNCVDCYKHSNEKKNDKWFCFPCRKPHKLVWAKQKGYPHWPAKVMREAGSNCDVRFFGGKYERSMLSKTCIKPINTSLSQLQIKRTATFNKALEEMTLHKKLLENPSELAKIQAIVDPKKPKKSLPKQKLLITPPKQKLLLNPPRPKSLLNPVGYNAPKPKPKPDKYANVMSGVKKPADKNTTTNACDIKAKTDKLPETKTDLGPFDLREEIKKCEVIGTGSRKRPSLSAPSGSKPKKTLSTESLLEKFVGKSSKNSQDVINLSDVEDNKGPFHVNDKDVQFIDSEHEPVTSSTEYTRLTEEPIFQTDGVMQKLDQPYSDAVEKMRRKLEHISDKKQVVTIAMDCMQLETDKLTNEHNDSLKRLFEAHNAHISETKKKQWCYNCEQDAIYHCCWNTAYCSPTCQQQHWQAEHKKVCRRKR